MSITAWKRGGELAAPDPSTRVEKDSAAQRRGELIVAAGLGGILVVVASRFVTLVDLPSFSVLLVAALGTALVLVGVVKRRLSRPELSTDWVAADEVVEVVASVELVAAVEASPVMVDLPSLTGQIGGVLAELRQQYGLAYRTRTWIEDILPAYGDVLKDPTLARDLLAAAALDAGGIRADVHGLAESHSRDDIIATGSALLAALQQVLAACDGSTVDLPAPPASDPSLWPASKV